MYRARKQCPKKKCLGWVLGSAAESSDCSWGSAPTQRPAPTLNERDDNRALPNLFLGIQPAQLFGLGQTAYADP